jgi:hypothetical protein
MKNIASRVEVELRDLMRAKARMSALLPCTRASFLLGWVITVVVVTYVEVHTTARRDLVTTTPTPENLKCDGRWLYVYNLSEVYNRDFVRDCATFKKGRDLCMYMENGGLGRAFRFQVANVFCGYIDRQLAI